MASKKQQFLTALSDHLKTPKDFDRFFSDLLTPGEYEDLIDRFLICRELAAGKTVQNVCQTLDVASATVVRGNRVLKHGSGQVKKMVQS